MSLAKKCAWVHRCVIYTTGHASSQLQPLITLKLWHLFPLNLHILMPSYTVPYIPNLKEVTSAVPETLVLETSQIYFVFLIRLQICSCAKFGIQAKPYGSLEW